MADFLIVVSTKNLAYRRGDIVAVEPDNSPRGARENIAEGFAVYRQPGISVEEFYGLQDDPEAGIPYLDETLLPPGVLAQAESEGILNGTPEGLPLFLLALKWR